MQVSSGVVDFAVGVVAGIHFMIAFGEMFLWKRVYPKLKQFNFSDTEAAKAGPIVANAGLYNAFLAAGLLWTILSPAGSQGVRLFLLACVMIAGIFGAVTLKAPKTLGMQTLPALVAACLVWVAGQ